MNPPPPMFTSRSALQSWMEELTKSVLQCYDNGHEVYIHSYYKDFIIGGKNQPAVIIKFTDSCKPMSSDEMFKDIQTGG